MRRRYPTMTMTMTRQRPTSLLLLLAFIFAQTVTGLPYFYVTSGRPKCVTAEIPKNTYVKIHFDAPDVMIDKNDPKYGPTYLSILEKPTPSALEVAREEEGKAVHHNKVKKMKNASPVSHELLEPIGFYGHKLAEDSQINVCIRASLAGSKTPMRFGLRVEEMGGEEAFQDPSITVDKHLGFIENQLERIESQMHAVLSEADFSKDRDAIYHSKTDAMHKATLFWPIVHVGILLVTGFTQANHIVHFFKKRRLI